MNHNLNCCTYFFDEENEIYIRPEALLNLINACPSSSCCEKLDKDLQDESVTHITNKYEEFQTKVRDGHLGNTAQFWISFMDNSKLIFLLTQAVKINNRKLFHKCNGQWPISSFPMSKITQGEFYFHFFEIPLDNVKILKQHSWGKTINRYYDKKSRLIYNFFFLRYLSWFEVYLTNLELTHLGAMDLIDSAVLDAARSLIPGSLCDIDRTMERLFTKFAKESVPLFLLFW